MVPGTYVCIYDTMKHLDRFAVVVSGWELWDVREFAGLLALWVLESHNPKGPSTQYLATLGVW